MGGVMPVCRSADTMDDLLRHAIGAVRSEGTGNQASRGETIEVVGAVLELRNPRARLSRTEKRRRESAAVAELSWYLRGTNDGEAIAFWIPKYRDEFEDDGTVHGGYGPRLFGDGADAQILNIVSMLRDNPSTRRAVVQIFDRRDVTGGYRYKDVPCTTTLQFLLRKDGLTLIANMRSNDVYMGLPLDVFSFTMLQELVARDLGVDMGPYVHSVGSLHLYTRNLPDVDQFLAEGWQSTDSPMPPMPAGSQWDNVRALLAAEEQLRIGLPLEEVTMPTEPYWGDLVRVLAHRLAVRAGNAVLAESVAQAIHHPAFADFIT